MDASLTFHSPRQRPGPNVTKWGPSRGFAAFQLLGRKSHLSVVVFSNFPGFLFLFRG